MLSGLFQYLQTFHVVTLSNMNETSSRIEVTDQQIMDHPDKFLYYFSVTLQVFTLSDLRGGGGGGGGGGGEWSRTPTKGFPR